jgi:hypothetical protein
MADTNDPDLVTVLETEDTFALALAQAALEEAEIDYLVTGDEPRHFSGFPGAFGAAGIGQAPLWKCSSKIQVRREAEAEARALLEPLLHPPEAIEGEEEKR